MSGRPLSIGPQTGLNRSISHLSSTSGRGPTPRRKSQYTPFSTLHAESSCIDIAVSPSSPRLRRSASVGGLHQLRNSMGLQFGSKGRRELVRANTSAMLPPISDGPSRPSTKKRSMASVFTASDACTAPPALDELPVINITKQHVSYEEVDECDHFVPKNIWAKRYNMKLHPYHEKVAYMQAYDTISLESDRCTNLLIQRLTNGSPSFHDYGDKPPAMVLDLGCGQGHWILNAANVWRDTEFVGLDLVDITLPAFETVENVRLVQGDFLNYKLPFSEETFDFIRMANLSLCIPYGQWEFVLDEVHRVLTPGGRLELIDDDIYFPYGEEWKEVEALFPESPLSGSFFGDERLETEIIRRDVDDHEVMQDGDTDDAETILMSRESPITAGAVDSSPNNSDLLSSLVRSRSHYVLRRKTRFSHAPPRDSSSNAPRRNERTAPTPTISHRSSPGHLRECSGSKTISKSVTSQVDVSSSSTTRNGGKRGISSPPCPKRTREKVALLPPIRSITPTPSLSNGTKYFPTWSPLSTDTSPTCSDASSIRTADTSPTMSMRNKVDSKNSLWQKKVSASKNMESLFEKMLIEQYGIHPRPADFMLQVLGKVFHEDGNDAAGGLRVKMKKSAHIKLAPIMDGDQSDGVRLGAKGKGRSSIDEADGVGSTSVEMSSTLTTIEPEKQNGITVPTLISRPWESGQEKGPKGTWPRSKDRKTKLKLEEWYGKQAKVKKNQADAVDTAATMTTSLFKKSRLQDPALSSPVGPALSAKAASILGIPYSELSAVTSSLRSNESRSSPMPLPCSRPSNLSAKAAVCLGIPYSEALSAAASLSVVHGTTYPTERSSTSTFSPTIGSEFASSPSSTTSGPVQHTGLLIWPDTYVPMAAGELEMHACKYIHTLLGCRPALEDFVAKFVDERGERFIGEEELNDEIWDYECFRRARFNWPSEIAESYEEDSTISNAAEPSSPLPPTTSNSSDAGTGGTVDVNPTIANTPLTMTGSVTGNGPVLTSLPTARTHQPSPTDNSGAFSNEKLLWPTSSSLSRSSSNRQRSPPMPTTAKSQMTSLSRISRSASPAPSCSKKNSFESMADGKALNDLVHLRSIRVFEGIKAT